MRPSGRAPDQMRAINMEPGFTRHAEGSCLVSFGDTRVLCTASVETNLPAWLRGKGRGWVTGEYGMLPRATHTRGRREAAGGKQTGPDPGDPAADRPLPARRRRPRGARRAPDHARLRRHPGRRRHPHGGDLRRLGGASARGGRAHRQEADRGRPDPAEGGGGELRHPRRSRGARPRLCRGQLGRLRRQFRAHRRRQAGRGADHRGGRVFRRGRAAAALRLARIGCAEIFAAQDKATGR